MSDRRATARVLSLSIGVLAGLAAVARADTIYVPADHDTIQEAVDASRPGDVVIVEAGTYHENVVVSGIAHHGVQIYGAGLVVIEGTGTEPALTVKNTWEVGVHTLTLRSGGDGLFVARASDFLAESITVDAVPGDGMRVEGSRAVSLSMNHVYDAGGDGIEVGGSYYVKLVENQVMGATETGIEVSGTDALTVFENDVHGTGGDGIALADGHDLSVCTNIVSDCGGDGVACEDASMLVVDETTVDDVGGDALTVERVDGVAVYNNTFGTDAETAGVGGDGVHVEASSAIDMEFNYVAEVSGHGVCVLGAGATIESNVIVRPGDTAIWVAEGATYAYVADNTIRDSGGSSVVVDGTESTISGNRIDGAGAAGIEIHGGNNVVGDNVVDRPATDGVSVTNGAADLGVIVENNSVVRPGDDGVDLGGTSNSQIAGNTVVKARDNGFELLTGVGNLFDGNEAKKSRGFDLFEGTDTGANAVEATNAFKKMNKRGHRHRRHR